MNRRDFIRAGGTAAAGSLLAKSGVTKPQPVKVALVGTGIRGSTMWGRNLVRNYAEEVEFVGLCDPNPGRLEFVREFMGVHCPVFTNFEQMMSQTDPDTVIVTTVDATHHQYIIRAMELGCDAITEKPMTTDAEKCQAILDAQAVTGKDVTVTFNYRYSPHRQKMKELLMNHRIGRVTSVDFHWYLDINHGASYFRRWHGKERFGGTLLVHKATHHFDLLNWWLESDPEEVFAYGDLEYYGYNNDFRHTNCRSCPHTSKCKHYWDITRDPSSMNLYVAHEHHDGYLRDGCVWSEEIDIYDKMSAQIRYANGVHVSYSCTTYSPYEGYRIAFNGTEGRLEAWIEEMQPWPKKPYDELRVTDNFGETELIRISHDSGGHGGGDQRLTDHVFKGSEVSDPYRQAAGARDGAMSVLTGVAARESVKTGEPVRIESLTSLKPRAVRP